MKRTITTIISCLFVLTAFLVMPAPALADQQADLSAQTRRALARINDARANPRAAAARLGMAEQNVRATLGRDAWILDQGLPPLAMNARLALSAASHNGDMLAGNYYSYASRDGRSPQERVTATGYPAVQSGESIAALAFNTFVSIDMAADSMIDSILRDELSGTKGVTRNIFSGYPEAGISLMADSRGLLFPGNAYAYLLVIDFGQSQEEGAPDLLDDMAFDLLEHVNEARTNPRLVMARFGLSEETVRRALGSDAWILDSGLPQLGWNEYLREAALLAGNQKRDLFLNRAVLPAAASQTERVRAAGYDAVATGESVLVHVCDTDYTTDNDIRTVLLAMLDQQMRYELTGAPWVRRNIFSAAYSELGISPREVGDTLMTAADAGIAVRPDVYLVVLDFASPRE